MFSISASLDADLFPDDILALLGLDDHGRVQQTIDQSVIDYCQPYVPASPDRTLEFSAQVSTDIGSGMVIWNTPYAHYQYAGIVYGPNIPIIDPETGVLMGWFSPPGRPKHPTDRNLTYNTSQNPMAGPYWFERMKADRLGDILDAAANAVMQGE
jgi:hypothetical protein